MGGLRARSGQPPCFSAVGATVSPGGDLGLAGEPDGAAIPATVARGGGGSKGLAHRREYSTERVTGHMTRSSRKAGLSLSGGAARGLAHIGLGILLSRVFIVSINAMQGYALDHVAPIQGLAFAFVIALVVSQVAAVWPSGHAARRTMDAIQFEKRAASGRCRSVHTEPGSPSGGGSLGDRPLLGCAQPPRAVDRLMEW